MTTEIVPMKYRRGPRGADLVRLNAMIAEVLRGHARDRQRIESAGAAVIEAARAAGMSWQTIAAHLDVKPDTLRAAHERIAGRP